MYGSKSYGSFRRNSAIGKRRYTAYTEELPGAISEGETLDEACENLRDAVKVLVDANRTIARKPKPGRDIVRETITISAS